MPSRDWHALFDALAHDHEQLAATVSAEMRRQLPAYAAIPVERLIPDVLIELDRVMQSARAGRAAVSERELADLAAVGEARAQQGVPVAEMLRGWRIGVQAVVAHARELGTRLDIDPISLVDFVESTLAWSDVAMVITAEAHRDAELVGARQDQERRALFVRGLLFGTLAPSDIGVQASAYGIDPTRRYAALRARRSTADSMIAFGRQLGWHPLASPRPGLVTLIEGDLAGFAHIPPGDIADAVVGVGPARPLERLGESFRLATRALITAEAFGLSGAHDVSGLGLRVAIAADGDVGEALSARYVEPLAAEPSGEELVTSLRAYYESGMHFDRAASRLFVHQNTLRYRIGRFEALTGASLRDPKVAFEVWWALEHSTLAGDPDQTPEDLEPSPKLEA